MLSLALLNIVLTKVVAASRLSISSNSVYMLEQSDFSADNTSIVIKYDFEEDPAMRNIEKAWYLWPDGTGKTAYDYSKSDGPLGL